MRTLIASDSPIQVPPFIPVPWDPIASLLPAQQGQMEQYARLLQEVNRKINLVSRGSAEDVWGRHFVHSLALSLYPFPAGASVVDWGTGGGLPAVPLAIRFPEAAVYAVDSVGKKIRALEAMKQELGLTNLHLWNGRAEKWPGRANYSVSRATAPLCDLWRWHVRIAAGLPGDPGPDFWQPGLLCLKGGDLSAEQEALRRRHPGVQVRTLALEPLLGSPLYAEKYIVQVTHSGA